MHGFADIKWFRLEKYYADADDANVTFSLSFIEQPLYLQYFYILFLCVLGMCIHSLFIQIA